MNLVWGIVLIIVGLYLLMSAIRKRASGIYRLFVARSKILWKENVHRFYLVVGVLVVGFGTLVCLGMVF